MTDNIIDELVQAARMATLPGHFQWGSDAIESFNFGKNRAAEAVKEAAAHSGLAHRMRKLRLWHWRQVAPLRDAAAVYTKAGQPLMARDANKIADTHIGFVTWLNDFFPAGDTAEQDEAEARTFDLDQADLERLAEDKERFDPRYGG